MCMLCDMGVDETEEHVFLECEGYADEREVLFEVVSGGCWGERNACWCGWTI